MFIVVFLSPAVILFYHLNCKTWSWQSSASMCCMWLVPGHLIGPVDMWSRSLLSCVLVVRSALSAFWTFSWFSQEHDLERQKQQQVFLLQELEEQKAQLEQMLLEARQERERLKAAAIQEVPKNQSEGSVWEQEVTSEVGLLIQIQRMRSMFVRDHHVYSYFQIGFRGVRACVLNL